MANRPIFVVNDNKKELFKEVNIEFTFYNGFAVTQKAKSIQSLHDNAKKLGYKNILEVSTKSDNKLGWQLSAFNLMVDFDFDKKISLECAFQGSKVFENNIQYNNHHFQSGKLDRTFLITKISKRNSLNGIHSQYNQHHAQIPWMFTIPHQPCNRIEEDQTQQQKQERYAPYHQ